MFYKEERTVVKSSLIIDSSCGILVANICNKCVKMTARVVELKLKLRIADDEFAKKLESVIKKSLFDIDFSVDRFAKEMLLSRSQLYRKLRNETGFTSSEFIRQKRIEVACELLVNTNLKIGEVSDHVGFKDDSYFTRCFREIVGITPTEYREEQKN